MEQSTKLKRSSAWLRHLPPLEWLAHYEPFWLTGDFVAGVTLAAYAIPVALAYATLAGLPCNGKDYRLRQTPCDIQSSRRCEMDGK